MKIARKKIQKVLSKNTIFILNKITKCFQFSSTLEARFLLRIKYNLYKDMMTNGNGHLIWLCIYLYKFFKKNTNIIITQKQLDNEYYQQNYFLKTIIIPKDVQCIPSYAFEDCINLQEVHIYNSKLHICTDAFKNCIKLKKVKVYNEYNHIKTI